MRCQLGTHAGEPFIHRPRIRVQIDEEEPAEILDGHFRQADILAAESFDGLDVRSGAELAAEAGTMPWICAYLAIDSDGKADGHGAEPVMHDGRVVGSTSSVAYGHSVGKVLAFTYIKPEAAAPGTALEVVVINEARKAVVLGEAAWDPQNLLPRTDG